MSAAISITMTEDKRDTPARIEIQEVESPTVQAKQAIGVFDSGSGGMVAAAHLTRILRDTNENVSVIFFGDTANLPYGKKTQEQVAGPLGFHVAVGIENVCDVGPGSSSLITATCGVRA